MTNSRTIAIGDIHGCSAAVAAILNLIDPQSTDTIVTLGDYVDRGLESRGVIDQLLALAGRCHLVPILGNHDELMLAARQGGAELTKWLAFGGTVALDSYGPRGLGDVPDEHWEFLESCLLYYETKDWFFVHANYQSDRPLNEQSGEVLRWRSLREFVPGPHCSGRKACMGHTPHEQILDLGHMICIDTGCGLGGWLTALDLGSGQLWRADESGTLHVG